MLRSVLITGTLCFAHALPVQAQSFEAVAPASTKVVAARDLARGEILGPTDFQLEGDFDGEDVGPVGWVTRRVVSAGEPLRPPTIAPADVVRSGDTVQLVWSDGSLELRLTGRAMNSAAAGESVRVRVDNRRRFEGIALEEGIVLLDSPRLGRGR